MFWISYRITPTTEDPVLAARLLTDEFWTADNWRGATFRSRALGVPASFAFPAISGLVEPARVNMRGLYILHPDDLSRPTTTAAAGRPGWISHLLRRLLGRAD